MVAAALPAREPNVLFHDRIRKYSRSGGDLARLALKSDIGAASESPDTDGDAPAGLLLALG